MLKTIGYEFKHGRWVPRWWLVGPAWVDLVYPQNNTPIPGSYLEPSFVFTPYVPTPPIQGSLPDIELKPKALKAIQTMMAELQAIGASVEFQTHDEIYIKCVPGTEAQVNAIRTKCVLSQFENLTPVPEKEKT